MKQISYNCPSDLLAKINDETKVGSYSSRSEFITTAIRCCFDNREKEFNLHEEIKKFLESSEGKKVLMNIYQEFDEKRKS